MPRPSARQLALALALGAVLAACSDDGDKPQVLPSVTTPSPTPSKSPAPSVSPTGSDASAAGVEAFIKSYYAEINRAIETGDVSTLTSYSVPACPCRRLVESIREKTTGSRIQGGEFTLSTVSPHDVTPTLAGAEVLYDVAKAEVVKSDGRVIETVKAAPGARDDISVVRYNDRWLVSNVLILN